MTEGIGSMGALGFFFGIIWDQGCAGVAGNYMTQCNVHRIQASILTGNQYTHYLPLLLSPVHRCVCISLRGGRPCILLPGAPDRRPYPVKYSGALVIYLIQLR